MKTIHEFMVFLKFGSIFLAIGTLLMTCNAHNDDLKEIEKIKNGIETAKKGFLRIKTYSGRGSRSVTISVYGYIEGVDSSIVDSRRVIIGVGEVYSKDFEDKFEEDLIPIWYDVSKNFVYARVYKTSKETITKMSEAVERSKKLYIKANLILMFLPFLFYFFQKLTHKPEYD